ncbi:hypothetical protein V1503_19060 [Bacillus sp. SCS-151]|uniref:hypothetical protein n=1 Tax=Nanhaiella sioensis TaxID=3115293 RepID=UPI0039790352
MAYTWEKECLEKFGEEVTANLIKRQQEYEREKKDNDCNKCGKGNEGCINEWTGGRPVLMHYGLWVDGVCDYCGKHTV